MSVLEWESHTVGMAMASRSGQNSIEVKRTRELEYWIHRYYDKDCNIVIIIVLCFLELEWSYKIHAGVYM